MHFISLSAILSVLFFTTSLSAQQEYEANQSDLLNLVMASQAICYDYDASSDTCDTVSFFDYSEQGKLISYDIILFSDSNPDFTKLLFGEEVFSELSQSDYLKVIAAGPIEVDGNSICFELGGNVKIFVFLSRDANPWIHEGDRPIADVSDRFMVLFEGFAKIEMGLQSIGRFCDVLDDEAVVGKFQEFQYKSFADGREFPEQESHSQTIRFHFSKDIPRLRVQ